MEPPRCHHLSFSLFPGVAVYLATGVVEEADFLEADTRFRLNRSLGMCTATVPRRRGLRNLCIEHGGLASRKGFGRLVLLGYGRCRPCTCNLSTSSSLTALCGNLILGRASCLDAFSTYPDQTRIPGGAPGGTTGKPEVCPARSSRTSAGASQISYAHNR